MYAIHFTDFRTGYRLMYHNSMDIIGILYGVEARLEYLRLVPLASTKRIQGKFEEFYSIVKLLSRV